jgi:ATP synthase protein I
MTAQDRTPYDAWTGMGTGWSITSTLIGGMAALGGLGYLIGRLIGAPRVFTGIGFVLGAAGAIYAIYLRYGKGESGDS